MANFWLGFAAGLGASALARFVLRASGQGLDLSPNAVTALIGAVVGGFIGVGGMAVVELFKRRITVAPHLTLTSGALLYLSIPLAMFRKFLGDSKLNNGEDIPPDTSEVIWIAESLEKDSRDLKTVIQVSAQLLPAISVKDYFLLK